MSGADQPPLPDCRGGHRSRVRGDCVGMARRVADVCLRPCTVSWCCCAFLYFAAISIVLTLIDLDTHRLPNVIVLPSYLVAAGLFIAACVFGADWGALLRAAIGLAVLYGSYFMIRLIRPDGMGGGDVKLAGLLGLYLGWIGSGAIAVGAFTAFLLGGIYGVALMAVRRAGRNRPYRSDRG